LNQRCLCFFWVGCCALLFGCSSAPVGEQPSAGHSIVISGIVIRNELPYPVTDVMIEVPSTGNLAGCGNILPRSECSNAFEQLDYRANPVVIRWKEHGQPQQTDEFTIKMPGAARPGDAYRVEVIVFAPGQAGARLAEPVSTGVRNR